MSDPFLGELRLAGFSFAPVGWAAANGQLMAISQNTALFALLGANFGGNGVSTFALPNLQGSIPVGAGQGPGLTAYAVGESGGQQMETLLLSEMPQHTHTANAYKPDATANTPSGNAFATDAPATGNLYTTDATPNNLVRMNPSILTLYGGNAPHNNMMPYLTLNWIISLVGVFPSRD